MVETGMRNSCRNRVVALVGAGFDVQVRTLYGLLVGMELGMLVDVGSGTLRVLSLGVLVEVERWCQITGHR